MEKNDPARFLCFLNKSLITSSCGDDLSTAFNPSRNKRPHKMLEEAVTEKPKI